MWVLINASYKPSLGAPGHVTEILQGENMQKVDEFEPIYLGNACIDEKWSAIFEHTINQISFGYVCFYPNLNTIFLVLHIFSYFFSLTAIYV